MRRVRVRNVTVLCPTENLYPSRHKLPPVAYIKLVSIGLPGHFRLCHQLIDAEGQGTCDNRQKQESETKAFPTRTIGRAAEHEVEHSFCDAESSRARPIP